MVLINLKYLVLKSPEGLGQPKVNDEPIPTLSTLDHSGANKPTMTLWKRAKRTENQKAKEFFANGSLGFVWNSKIYSSAIVFFFGEKLDFSVGWLGRLCSQCLKGLSERTATGVQAMKPVVGKYTHFFCSLLASTTPQSSSLLANIPIEWKIDENFRILHFLKHLHIKRILKIFG